MPFYDDFDLSTVDVLLISQYVFTTALRTSFEVGGPGVSLQSYMHGGHFWGQRLVYEKQWNIFCTIQSDSGHVPPPPGPHVHGSLSSTLYCPPRQQSDVLKFLS